jgi:hypothetical protein
MSSFTFDDRKFFAKLLLQTCASEPDLVDTKAVYISYLANLTDLRLQFWLPWFRVK